MELVKEYKDFNCFMSNLPRLMQKDDENNVYTEFIQKLNFFKNCREPLSPEEDQIEMKKFRIICHPRVLQATFPYYVFTKPRGYPGDYMVQEMIWNSKILSRKNSYIGISELGKILNHFTLKMENPKANIERYGIIQQHINNYKGKRIASLGCGSGIEYWDCDNSDCANVFMLDQDSEALDRAKQKILGNGNANNFIFNNSNILKFVLSERNLETMGERDLIYLLGLLDYFDVKSSKRIVSKIWANLSSGGSLVFSNANGSNPTKFWMEYGGDWFLNYKTEAEMKSLADGLNDIRKMNFSTDSYGIYQYLEIVKN